MSEVPLPTSDTRSDNVDIVEQSLESLQVVENAPLDVSGAAVTTDPDSDLQADIDQMISLLEDIKANTSA